MGLTRRTSITVLRLVGIESTTPNRLRLFWIASVVGAVLCSSFLYLYASERNRVMAHAADDELTVVAAQNIRIHMSAADAAASNAFLAGGGEDPEQRALYQASLDDASAAVAQVAASVGQDQTQLAQVVEIKSAIIEYSGLVEAARANNRQGFPVGAAYLASASDLLVTDLYPATDDLANTKAIRYRANITWSLPLLGLAVFAGGSLVLFTIFLVGGHRNLAKTFNRRYNLGVVGGVLLVVGVFGWGFVTSLNQIDSAQRAFGEYELVRDLVNVRSGALQVRNQEAQFIIARGAIAEDDFADDTLLVSNELERITEEVDDEKSRVVVDGLLARWETYILQRQELPEAVDDDRQAAIETSLGPSVELFDEFDGLLAVRIAEIQSDFRDEMDRAQQSTAALPFAGPAMLLTAAAFVYLGVQPRVREYR